MSEKESVALPLTSARGFSHTGGNLHWPSNIATACPHCGSAAIFGWKSNQTNSVAGVCSGSSHCPNTECAKLVRFVAFYKSAEQYFEKHPYEIRMFPRQTANFALPDFGEEIPERLAKSLEDTIKAFNAQIYGACATSGRRTLEGIFKNMLPKEKRDQTLFKLISDAENEIDFRKPLKRLADAIRNGGNLGAHFDEEREPDAEMARQMIELLNYLIEYLYVLPSQIENLEIAIEQKKMTNGVAK